MLKMHIHAHKQTNQKINKSIENKYIYKRNVSEKESISIYHPFSIFTHLTYKEGLLFNA